jgi:hypothetical protein
MRREWFARPQWPTYTLWWVPDTHVPTWAEAFERQHQLRTAGPTPVAFSFKHPFDENGAPLAPVGGKAA